MLPTTSCSPTTTQQAANGAMVATNLSGVSTTGSHLATKISLRRNSSSIRSDACTCPCSCPSMLTAAWCEGSVPYPRSTARSPVAISLFSLWEGNHQLLAGDLGQLIDGLKENTGCWVRGLAHPFVVGGGGGGGNAGPAGGNEPNLELNTGLSSPVLSRFDVVLVLIDSADELGTGASPRVSKTLKL